MAKHEVKESDQDFKFNNAMDLLNNAIINVNEVSEWTGQIAYLIDFLRETADKFEEICVESYGTRWRSNANYDTRWRSNANYDTRSRANANYGEDWRD